MEMTITRARELACELEERAIFGDFALIGEVQSVLKTLADTTVEAQRSTLSSVEFALSYYSVPYLYTSPEMQGRELLDGGLRARTALGLIKRGCKRGARRTYLRENSYE